MADNSFDVVSSVDLQEVKNAIAQATKEIQTLGIDMQFTNYR